MFCKSSVEQTSLSLSLDRACHISSSHHRGGCDEGGSIGGNLQPHCRMLLNPPHWTLNIGLEPPMLLELPHNKSKSLPLALNNYWLYSPHHVYFKIDMVWKVYGHALQDQVVGVKGVGVLYAAVSWRSEMKATVDTFVPTHIKGPFEGRALCDHSVMMVSRGRSGVITAGQAHIDCNLSLSLPPSTIMKSNRWMYHL